MNGAQVLHLKYDKLRGKKIFLDPGYGPAPRRSVSVSVLRLMPPQHCTQISFKKMAGWINIRGVPVFSLSNIINPSTLQND